jgi:hypothetical protein
MSLYISKPRTPKRRKHPKAGPQYRGAASAVHPKGTPGGQLSHLGVSSIATPNRKEQFRHIPDARGDESIQDLGPTTSSGEFRAVRSRGTRVANSSYLDVSLIAISKTGISPFLFTNAESSFESEHRVTAHGHLVNKELRKGGQRRRAQSPKGSSRSPGAI